MKIVTIQGSPKKDGNTATALALFEKAVGGKHEVDHIEVPDLDMVGCQACYKCMQHTDEPGCATDDDALEVLDSIRAADAIVYATPLYMWGIASCMRGLMERHFCLVKGYGGTNRKSLVSGKRIALLVTCAGPVEHNADLVQSVFDRFAGYLDCEVVGKYVAHGATTPDSAEDFAGEVAERMAADFGA
jgi:multimeric flavodoxin WrbA